MVGLVGRDHFVASLAKAQRMNKVVKEMYEVNALSAGTDSDKHLRINGCDLRLRAGSCDRAHVVAQALGFHCESVGYRGFVKQRGCGKNLQEGPVDLFDLTPGLGGGGPC